MKFCPIIFYLFFVQTKFGQNIEKYQIFQMCWHKIFRNYYFEDRLIKLKKWFR